MYSRSLRTSRSTTSLNRTTYINTLFVAVGSQVPQSLGARKSNAQKQKNSLGARTSNRPASGLIQRSVSSDSSSLRSKRLYSPDTPSATCPEKITLVSESRPVGLFQIYTNILSHFIQTHGHTDDDDDNEVIACNRLLCLCDCVSLSCAYICEESPTTAADVAAADDLWEGKHTTMMASTIVRLIASSDWRCVEAARCVLNARPF